MSIFKSQEFAKYRRNFKLYKLKRNEAILDMDIGNEILRSHAYIGLDYFILMEGSTAYPSIDPNQLWKIQEITDWKTNATSRLQVRDRMMKIYNGYDFRTMTDIVNVVNDNFEILLWVFYNIDKPSLQDMIKDINNKYEKLYKIAINNKFTFNDSNVYFNNLINIIACINDPTLQKAFFSKQANQKGLTLPAFITNLKTNINKQAKKYDIIAYNQILTLKKINNYNIIDPVTFYETIEQDYEDSLKKINNEIAKLSA